MAIVHLATDLKHQRKVAIKVMRPELASALGTDRFLREIEIAARLQHPRIVPLYDSGEADGLLYYVMPYVEGETLRDRLLREKQLPHEEAMSIARAVGDALSYAHSHGVIHRDIKPENILLAGDQAVVADFGIARAISAAGGERITSAGIAIGTPVYMSPEQAAGSQDLDARSDVYSLGCVLYEMLAGHPPFMGATPQEILARHTLDPVPPLRTARATVPPATDQAILRALAKSPADRFRTAGEFVEALRATRPPAGSAGMAAGARRLALVVSGAAVLALGAFLAWSWRGRAPPTGSSPALDPTHVAVLYFEDLSEGTSLGHVANGLTEDLIDELSLVPALHVVSPNGVRPYRDRAMPLDSLARALRVGTFVEGSVAGSPRQLRVTVRLIDAASLRQVASTTLERGGTELFALLDDVAGEVSRVLRERLGREIVTAERRSGTRNQQAWEAVQRADALRHDAFDVGLRLGADSITGHLRRADSLLALAERLDRSWPVPVLERGWLAVWRATLVVSAADRPGPRVSSEAARFLDLGLAYAERARRMSGAEAEALDLRGQARYERWGLGGALATDTLIADARHDLEHATELDSTRAGAWKALSDVYQAQGDTAAADAAARHALRADAYLVGAAAVMSRLLFAALSGGRFDEARRWCDEGRQRFPGDPRFLQCDLTILGFSGNGRDAVHEAWRDLAEIEAQAESRLTQDTRPLRRLWVAAVLARSGMADSSRAVLVRTRAEVGDSVRWQVVAPTEAFVRILLGERDEALRVLTTYLERQPGSRAFVAQSLMFAGLHDDPRFAALVGTRR